MPIDSKTRSRRAAVLAALAGVLAAFALPAPAGAAPAPTGCENRTNNTHAKLLECVTLAGVREHQAALQEIGEANDDPFYPGTRAAGTKGYADSVEYVAGLLDDAGYDVTLDEFEFAFQFPALLRQLTPVDALYETGSFTNSGFGDVTAPVVPVDLSLTTPAASTSGCQGDFTEAAVGAPIVPDPGGPNDFDGFTPGSIALIQRGTCSFALKVTNAASAGATAVIIFNQGTPDRLPLIVGTVAPATPTIPVVGASFANGVALSQPGSTARVRVIAPEIRTDYNVIAELPGANPNNVVMAGAHLDSEVLGPGINDNGSGSAAILETALMMAKLTPQNTLRFAWWGAEESGLVGSTAYVEGLSQAERDRIGLYLNYDMVGSPNYIFMVYDADQSSFPPPAGVPIPPGSPAIEDLFESFYTLVGEPYDDAQFSGRSDYQAFIEAGIPSGGLFTGAEGIKTAEQQAIWGGTTGAQFDPCYHIACDTYANNNDHALEVNSDLIAFAQLTYAYSTETVNGVAGKSAPDAPTLPAPAGPEGTFVP
jgi:Zn-dependent M28 family amino/carboxypeptidase